MPSTPDLRLMRLALTLAKRGCGTTSPNPMVGAVLVKRGEIVGRGWHRRAGEPHAEIEAIRDAESRGRKVAGATLYVTLEPCCTYGRTPPCTEAIKSAGIGRIVVGAIDPNPRHAGKGITLLRREGIPVTTGILEEDSQRLNEAFNHWVVHSTPFVTVKAAMSLDGKIATRTGESKWITGAKARAFGMKLRQGADAVLVGVNTVLADNPSLTWRPKGAELNIKRSTFNVQRSTSTAKRLRRIILDANARTPLNSKVVSDSFAQFTTIVVTEAASRKRVKALAERARVWVGPVSEPGKIDLHWLMAKLGGEDVTSLLVEGGGEVNASFFWEGRAQRIAFFYAPKIIGGRDAVKAVGGAGFGGLDDALHLREVEWRQLGPDLLLTARVQG